MAGLVRRHVKDLRGRDRLCALIIGKGPPPAGTHRGEFGPGIRFTADYRRDSSLVDLFFAQYEQPSLVPIVRAFLKPGDCFYDVGANVGIYSLWASKLVGPTGQVHSFEPISDTRELLRQLVLENNATNVVIAPYAVAGSSGSVKMQSIPGASGLSSATRQLDHSAVEVEVSAVTLDEYLGRCRRPDLVKVDVEGAELEVVRGMVGLLQNSRPPVIFEASPKTEREKEALKTVWGIFTNHQYSLFDLTPRGLRVSDGEGSSMNVLAANAELHGEQLRRLRHVRFKRNQNL